MIHVVILVPHTHWIFFNVCINMYKITRCYFQILFEKLVKIVFRESQWN